MSEQVEIRLTLEIGGKKHGVLMHVSEVHAVARELGSIVESTLLSYDSPLINIFNEEQA